MRVQEGEICIRLTRRKKESRTAASVDAFLSHVRTFVQVLGHFISATEGKFKKIGVGVEIMD